VFWVLLLSNLRTSSMSLLPSTNFQAAATKEPVQGGDENKDDGVDVSIGKYGTLPMIRSENVCTKTYVKVGQLTPAYADKMVCFLIHFVDLILLFVGLGSCTTTHHTFQGQDRVYCAATSGLYDSGCDGR
jgi:hypothetical protein